MDNFAKLAAIKRKPYFEETANRRNSTTTAIEKDFWVSWTLRHLFSLQDVPRMCFKGGTSLSKVYKLISRFSEDIDISLDRAAFGFTGARDLANKELSNTKRNALDEELKHAIHTEVTSKILPKLAERFSSIIGKLGWELKPSSEEMTILFSYPNTFDYKDYLKPEIKIEFGRGDQSPSNNLPISPIVAEEFPEIFTNPSAVIPTLACERTFWEKGTLLHAENHATRPLKPRMSRHWSDIAVMSVNKTFADGRLDFRLLEEVVEFKKIYFNSGWANYDSARPGTIRLVPSEALQKLLKDDYKDMREMFVGPPLSFEEMLERLKTLESRINSTAKN